jgi:outer membrane protein TolC
MSHPSSSPWPALSYLRRLAVRGWLAGLPVLLMGCGALPSLVDCLSPTPCVVRGVSEELPPPVPAQMPPESCPVGPVPPKVVPISLDTVLRLAEEKNPQIALARARVNEACAEREVAATHWVPDLYVGSAYYRHEGGIQDFTGRLIHSSYGALFEGLEVDACFDIRQVAFGIIQAERKTWEQKGELAKATNENLLDAATTYIDLLAARTAVASAMDLQAKMIDLLDRTQKLAKIEPGVQVEVDRIQAEISAGRVNICRLEEQAAAAASKLVYLLGLDPCIELLPIDSRLSPIELNDLSVSVCDLVARALTNGPGIHEMEGMLAVVNEGIERASGPARFLPVFELRMAEGAFGAGPGANLAWDNRWDLGLQARWNLTEFVALRQRREVTRARLEQLHLSHDDLRRKLTIGVQQVHSAILAAHSQIELSENQIDYARKAHELSKKRLQENIQNATPSEVLLSIQGLARAELNYITSIREYDKEQLKLMLLLGPACCVPPAAPAIPAP